MQVAKKKYKQKMNTGNAFVGYFDIIVRKIEFFTFDFHANR